MRKLLISTAAVIAFLLTMLASAGAASACMWVFYEPMTPAKLRK